MATFTIPSTNQHSLSHNVLVRKNKKAKKITLTINPKTLGLKVTIPQSTTYETALNFVKKNTDWINLQLSNRSIINFGTCPSITLMGQPFTIVDTPAQRGSAKINLATQTISIAAKNTEHRADMLLKLLKKQALSVFSSLSAIKAAELNVTFNKIIIMDSNKWGACSSNNNLRYNFRIIMAPFFIIDYLCAHEVAHLKEFNHSAAFWLTAQFLTKHCTIKEGKGWLKEHGRSLY